MGNGVMAAQENLDLLVRVRVLVPQPWASGEMADAPGLGPGSSEWGFESPLAH